MPNFYLYCITDYYTLHSDNSRTPHSENGVKQRIGIRMDITIQLNYFCHQPIIMMIFCRLIIIAFTATLGILSVVEEIENEEFSQRALLVIKKRYLTWYQRVLVRFVKLETWIRPFSREDAHQNKYGPTFWGQWWKMNMMTRNWSQNTTCSKVNNYITYTTSLITFASNFICYMQKNYE